MGWKIIGLFNAFKESVDVIDLLEIMICLNLLRNSKTYTFKTLQNE